MITISTEKDFEEIIKTYIEKALPLKLYINFNNSLIEEPPSEQEINEMFQLLRDQGYVDNEVNRDEIHEEIHEEIRDDNISSETDYIHNVACKLCTKSIIGTRWTCTICPAFNLCSDCEPQHYKSHPLIRITEQLPSGAATVFSLCTGLNNLNEKIHQIPEKDPIVCASTVAHNAKEEISSVYNSISSQIASGSKNLRQELEDFVGDATKIIEQIPNKLKDIQTKFSGVLSNCSSSLEDLKYTLAFEDKMRKSERFATQHKTLEEMGFLDRQKNEALLQQFCGNVEVCLNILLTTPQ